MSIVCTMLAPLEERRTEGVTQAVECEPLLQESGLLQERPVLPVVEVVVIHRRADAVGEDEIGVAPLRSRLSSF